MKTLLFGKDGQLGREFIPSILACSELLAVGRNECDLSSSEKIQVLIEKFKPNLIINTSAYTAVDQAQSEPEIARLINAQAPTVMAKAAESVGAVLVHYSTDYVFDGLKKEPYEELDTCSPLSVYGSTKQLGEQGVKDYCARHLIFRTSWVFSAHGNNFLKTILKLAKTKEELKVISDQWGAPTSTALLVSATLAALKKNAVINEKHEPVIRADKQKQSWGLFNLTAGGETNWHEYAQYVISSAVQMGMGDKFVLQASKILSIPSREYPQLAPRPLNSRLNTKKARETFDIQLPDWREGVDQELAKIVNNKELDKN